jgi:hypothetical protein
MFFIFILSFLLRNSLSTKPLSSFYFLKESILQKQTLIQNEGLDSRKNIFFEKDLIKEEQMILIAKYIEKKKLLDFLLNKDTSIHSKIDKIEKCNELLTNHFKSPYCPNLCLKKDFDEFLSS